MYREGNIAIDGISDVVYALNEKGAFSRPFFSQHGWHIVAVTDIQDKPSKEELRSEFLRRIKSDSRSKILEKRSEEHTSELQSRPHLVCRLLLEKKNIHTSDHN